METLMGNCKCYNSNTNNFRRFDASIFSKMHFYVRQKYVEPLFSLGLVPLFETGGCKVKLHYRSRYRNAANHKLLVTLVFGDAGDEKTLYPGSCNFFESI